MAVILTGGDIAYGAHKLGQQLDWDPLTEEQRTDIQERKEAVPKMLDTYEQASQIAKEQGISYEEALKQLDKPDVPGIDFNQGGRVGFAKGPKDPKRRLVLKGIGALAMLPIVGKYFKAGKLLTKAGAYTGPVIQKVQGMPEWLPSLVKRLWNEGEDVTKTASTMERQVVKRGTLESGDDVDNKGDDKGDDKGKGIDEGKGSSSTITVTRNDNSNSYNYEITEKSENQR